MFRKKKLDPNQFTRFYIKKNSIYRYNTRVNLRTFWDSIFSKYNLDYIETVTGPRFYRTKSPDYLDFAKFVYDEVAVSVFVPDDCESLDGVHRNV